MSIATPPLIPQSLHLHRSVVEALAHALSVFSLESGAEGRRSLLYVTPDHHLLLLPAALEFSLSFCQRLPPSPISRHLLDAILIALNTLCQLLKTSATAAIH